MEDISTEEVMPDEASSPPLQKPKSYKNLVLLAAVIVLALLVATLYVLKTYLQIRKYDPISVPAVDIQEHSVKNDKAEPALPSSRSYPIVDTNQEFCFDSSKTITCGSSFQGQDAQYQGTLPRYQDNNDGTITDLNTGLMWQKDPGAKVEYQTAISNVKEFNLGGYNDWRVPTIKELYSLMDFRGIDPPAEGTSKTISPFIDNDVFVFTYGKEIDGDRFIDSQMVTSSVYTSRVMSNEECFFGVNFADGRIKCYPTRKGKTYYAYYVRGSAYGENSFTDNNDGTITDKTTGLTWMQKDSGKALSWQESLSYCENLSLAGSVDWRLPNAKELQSIVDYSRSPDKTNSPAINPLLETSSITNEKGQNDYPYFWTSTTHVGLLSGGSKAVYISFGRAMGYMKEFGGWVDVHGAGAQRSDPKTGNAADYPQGHGPQGDAIRVKNYARCVSGGNVTTASGSNPSESTIKTQLQKKTMQQPPQEAITACNGKSESSQCQINASNGTVIGTCQRSADQLACIPEQ